MDNHNSDQDQPLRRTQHETLRSRPDSNRSGLWKKIILGVAVFFVACFVMAAGLFMYYAKGAPKITHAQLASDNATVIYDNKGKVLTRLGTQNRDYVNRKDIPKTLKNAIVSIEDRRFYKNNGVDPVRILGAAAANLTGSSLGLQGASTLTQQLVKLAVFSTDAKDRTLKVKAQEAWLAVQVDKKYSKDQILEFYINKVYMGNGVYGMQTASEYYFGKKLDKLNLSELSLLAGMPQSPTVYDPTKNPQFATARRNTVLQAMADNKAISASDAKKAQQADVKSGLSSTHGTLQTDTKKKKIIDPYLKEVVSDLSAKGYDPNKGGLKVYTNLDYAAQKKLYDLGNNNIEIQFPDDKFQVGASMVNNDNGKVVAMLGGRQTGDVTFGLNRAVQTDRSSGSTAKPIMDYGPALQYLNWPTNRKVKDISFTYPGSESPKDPNGVKLYDFDKRFKGTMTMRDALIQSRNVPAIRTLQDVGMSDATQFLKGLGISQKKPYDLANGIGLYISTLQEAAAYAAFANGGTFYKPYYINKIVQQDGKESTYKPQGNRAMSSSTAFMMTSMLKGVTTDPQGSGTAANIPGLNMATKTGTVAYPSDIAKQYPSDAASDSWMSGYTKHYSMSVWTGYDHANTATGYLTQQQTELAQLVWKYMMSYMAQFTSNDDWTMPASVEKKGSNDYQLIGKSYKTTGNSDLDPKNNSGSASKSVGNYSSSDSDNSRTNTNGTNGTTTSTSRFGTTNSPTSAFNH
ncbi:transglycosylase domain-containing protein [Pediococcus argentinicus]|uniref:Uncharacterized protein n=1 Tax=Pediococcus argentinicus TaxID=480391 RepID=A0A0R2NR05_9LACO|nr:transglycosylase domain-containing protein [Pediococcus argentinicus]KRO26339.1 hypothetical protein IV88_GL000124 [Pediococcus argentinicus]NKZ21469.1 carboxypeptidase [Pediococcus argentinicus]GEP18732.1 penicillin-binding protein 1A [Pediococcus argentinicus]